MTFPLDSVPSTPYCPPPAPLHQCVLTQPFGHLYLHLRAWRGLWLREAEGG